MSIWIVTSKETGIIMGIYSTYELAKHYYGESRYDIREMIVITE